MTFPQGLAASGDSLGPEARAQRLTSVPPQGHAGPGRSKAMQAPNTKEIEINKFMRLRKKWANPFIGNLLRLLEWGWFPNN
mmetsp:Transcript_91967/g.210637  ORF Transcript_91967/g.210637 Transcript_91967/m.210637 type:complete len:81 (-) Transcript_91967:62-304(-)